MNKKYKKSIVWIRRDLRLVDNKALIEASKSSDSIYIVFVFDKNILDKLKDKSDRRITFIYDSILELNNELEKHNSKVLVCYGDPCEEIPKIVNVLKVEALFCNEDYEPYAVKRDQKVKERLAELSVNFLTFKDHVIFSGNEIIKGDSKPYQKFTPYKNKWISKLNKNIIKDNSYKYCFASADKLFKKYKLIPLEDLGFKRAFFFYDFQKPGRSNAIKQLDEFSSVIENYNSSRDFPVLSGTSGLSVHLRFGTVSIRECLRLSLKSRKIGYSTWLNEIIWRDFYQMILHQFPHVQFDSFNQNYSKLNWPGEESNFNKWKKGETGFPIVDSAMKQLNTTGWMHNRLRMIVASFLTKDLLVDWRKGEEYFAEKLLDFDLAANNGGWQ
ncbi:MAG: deoxyribodipyrimidine photo-lyase, partial [Leptospiraceae bacterium]|nr:deoxyribodipyrimidine photo-lyase [Leptospiraceae bacterium]